ncbi:MAG: DUF4383 domain-containing protein [Patescibacteria group bacterium]|nr:DUF4383 domain-containing protein [Patescibacteria group bacterium]
MSRTISYIGGVIMVIAGLWAFVSAPVLGVFDANGALAVVWLVLGLILIAVAAWWANSAALTLKIIGVIALILAILGFVMSGSEVLGFLTNTMADNVLHLIFGIVYLAVGFMDKGSRNMSPAM